MGVEEKQVTRYFADVLALENLSLSNVNTRAHVTLWRERVVGELMNPHSPYSHVVQLTTATPERAHFLELWRSLLAETVERVLGRCPPVDSVPGALGDVRVAGSEDVGSQVVDPDRTAVLILAALHGGTTLGRVGDDPRGSINAALDLALAALNGDRDDSGSEIP
jgi:hypothetical protein